MKITIKIGDQTHVVDHEDENVDIEDGFVIQTQKAFDKTIKGRVNRAETDLKTIHELAISTLSSDDDHFKAIATSRGIDLDDKNIPVSKEDPERNKRQQEQWKSEFLAPKDRIIEGHKATIVSLTDDIEKARIVGIERDILAACPGAGVKDARLRTIFEGETPEFVSSTAKLMVWDQDRKAHYFKGDNGEPVYDGPNYAGAAKLLTMLRKRDKTFDYFEDRKPGSTGFDHSGTRGRTSVTSQDLADGNVDLEAVAKGEVEVV